jgi:hypothetical protein
METTQDRTSMSAPINGAVWSRSVRALVKKTDNQKQTGGRI